MTAQLPRPLAWRAWVGEQAEPSAIQQQAIEWCLLLAHDYDEPAAAMTMLRAVRPDLTVAEIGERIEQLTGLAERAADAELTGSYPALVCARGEYRDALAEFAGGRR